MKKIQRLFVAGTSLLLICFMAFASVLAIGNVSKQISITIHYDKEMNASIWASTFSDETANSFVQQIATHDSADFNTSKAKQLYQFRDSETTVNTNIATFESTGSFKFSTDDGILEIYFLIENSESVQLEYYVGYSYGTTPSSTSTYIELVPYVADNESTSTNLGASDNKIVVDAKTGETLGKSLIKLVFKLKDITTTPQLGGTDGIAESININLNVKRVTGTGD